MRATRQQRAGSLGCPRSPPPPSLPPSPCHTQPLPCHACTAPRRHRHRQSPPTVSHTSSLSQLPTPHLLLSHLEICTLAGPQQKGVLKTAIPTPGRTWSLTVAPSHSVPGARSWVRELCAAKAQPPNGRGTSDQHAHGHHLRQRHLSEQTVDSTCSHICNASDGTQPASKDGVETTSPRPKLEGRGTYPVFQF